MALGPQPDLSHLGDVDGDLPKCRNALGRKRSEFTGRCPPLFHQPVSGRHPLIGVRRCLRWNARIEPLSELSGDDHDPRQFHHVRELHLDLGFDHHYWLLYDYGNDHDDNWIDNDDDRFDDYDDRVDHDRVDHDDDRVDHDRVDHDYDRTDHDDNHSRLQHHPGNNPDHFDSHYNHHDRRSHWVGPVVDNRRHGVGNSGDGTGRWSGHPGDAPIHRRASYICCPWGGFAGSFGLVAPSGLADFRR